MSILSRIEAARSPTDHNTLEECSGGHSEPANDPTPQTSDSAWAVMRHLNGQGVRCNSRCSCRCHARKRPLRLRLNLFNGFLGSLTIVYSGWNFIGPRCNVLSCHNARFKLLEVDYCTSIQPRSVSIVASLKLMDGSPSITLSIGRTVHITGFDDHLSILVLCKTRKTSELKHVLERRPDAVLDVDYIRGWSALFYAASQGDYETVKILLAAGADPFLEDKSGYPAMLMCFRRIVLGHSSSQERDCLKNCLPLSAFFDEYHFSHIERVVLGIRPLRLQVELSKPIYKDELNAQDDMGITPLHWAAMTKDVSAVSALLHAGADVDTPHVGGNTALFEACGCNAEDCAKMLLAFGANVNAHRKDGYVPIHAAAMGNATRGLLSLLLSAGADVNNAQNIKNTSPLDLATIYNDAACCKDLLDLGADMEHVDLDGDTPLHASTVSNAHACTQLLLSQGANYLHKNNMGMTLFHQVARYGDERSLEIFTAADLAALDPDAKDSRSMTARQYFATRLGASLGTTKRFTALYEHLKKNADFGLYSSDDDDFYDALESIEI